MAPSPITEDGSNPLCKKFLGLVYNLCISELLKEALVIWRLS